jgi:hypothetical protein
MKYYKTTETAIWFNSSSVVKQNTCFECDGFSSCGFKRLVSDVSSAEFLRGDVYDDVSVTSACGSNRFWGNYA